MRILICALIASASLTAASWHELGKWSGDGTKNTETFATSQREWRIRWALDETGPRTIFDIAVRSAADDSLVSTANGKSSGETIVRAPVGRYYLRVAGANVKWTVTAEEQQP